jgi:hypothetical protein
MKGRAVGALIGGIGVLVASTARHRVQATASTVLAAAAEAVADPVRNPYVSSCTAIYNASIGITVPAGWAISSTTAYSDGTAAFTSSPGTCPAQPLQRVTVTVSAPLSAGTWTMDVTRRAT